MTARLAGGAFPPGEAPARVPLERPSPEEIRRFRLSMGMSRAHLATELGVTTRAVEHWETGRREPPAFLRLALAAIDRHIAPWTA